MDAKELENIKIERAKEIIKKCEHISEFHKKTEDFLTDEEKWEYWNNYWEKYDSNN